MVTLIIVKEDIKKKNINILKDIGAICKLCGEQRACMLMENEFGECTKNRSVKKYEFLIAFL